MAVRGLDELFDYIPIPSSFNREGYSISHSVCREKAMKEGDGHKNLELLNWGLTVYLEWQQSLRPGLIIT